MKKFILIFVLICGSSLVFANRKQHITINNNLNSSMLKTELTKVNNYTKVSVKRFDPCTRTITTYWYNEYGVYLGSTSNTVTYSGSSNTAWNCAMAELLAE